MKGARVFQGVGRKAGVRRGYAVEAESAESAEMRGVGCEIGFAEVWFRG